MGTSQVLSNAGTRIKTVLHLELETICFKNSVLLLICSSTFDRIIISHFPSGIFFVHHNF